MLNHVLSVVEVARTAARVAYHYDREPLDRLVDRLFSGRLLTRDLGTLTTTVERWLRYLPPRGMRPCLKRSLVHASLRARCGESPRLHIGFRPSSRGLEGHAWVSTGGPAPIPEGYTEIVALP